MFVLKNCVPKKVMWRSAFNPTLGAPSFGNVYGGLTSSEVAKPFVNHLACKEQIADEKCLHPHILIHMYVCIRTL
jgi:hypothetical protein